VARYSSVQNLATMLVEWKRQHASAEAELSPSCTPFQEESGPYSAAHKTRTEMAKHDYQLNREFLMAVEIHSTPHKSSISRKERLTGQRKDQLLLADCKRLMDGGFGRV
jgi:hypothetical protein